MPCVHLRQLIQLCEEHQIKVGGSDVVHFVCEQCGQQEVCPDIMLNEYDARAAANSSNADSVDSETK